ncbi:MAG TPA: MDR family MFS transporter [Verrucomicrobiae bacterium]|nr:MDR family MFS transporter [Verrucomicrobiae bacterium]
MEADTQQPTKIPKELRNLVWILVLGALAPMLDTTIVNVALPTLGHAMHASVNVSQWTITGYLLAMGIVIPVSGWLLERLGGKKLWVTALLFFLVGSALSGIAWSMPSLIIFRIIQGVAAGIIMPLMMTLGIQLAHRLAKGAPLGGLMAVATLPIVVVPVLGPVIGGLIVGNFDWRWIFYVNVPVCLIAAALAWWKLPADEAPAERHPFDILGFVQLAPAVALIFYGLSKATGSNGFDSQSAYIPLVIGLVLTVCFTIYALRKARPLINLRTLRVRAYAMSLAVLFLAGLSVYGPLLLISLFYQDVQHKSVLMTGLLLAPQGIGSLLPRIFSGKLVDKIGPRPVILGGLAVTVLGTLPFAFATAHTSEWLLAAVLFVRGLGLTPVNIAVMVGAFQGVPEKELPDASSTTRIIQQVGASFGVAVLTLILSRALLTHELPAQAFDVAFWWSIGFVVLALVPTLLLPKLVSKQP